MIYFIKESTTDNVKIGFAKTINNVKDRFEKHQLSNPRPLETINVINGSVKVEKAIHYYFRDYHIRGEWFNLDTSRYKDITNSDIPKILDIFNEDNSVSVAFNRRSIEIKEILTMHQLANGHISYKECHAKSTLSETQFSLYWNLLKSEFNVVDNSYSGMIKGHLYQTEVKELNIKTINSCVEQLMELKKPISSDNITVLSNISSHSTINNRLSELKLQIQEYHYSLFGVTSSRGATNAYNLIETIKANNIDESDLTVSELSKLSSIHINTLRANIKIIDLHFKGLLSTKVKRNY